MPTSGRSEIGEKNNKMKSCFGVVEAALSLFCRLIDNAGLITDETGSLMDKVKEFMDRGCQLIDNQDQIMDKRKKIT